MTLVQNIAHPISLARLVMEKTPHTVLGGEGVNRFAKQMGVPHVSNDELITQNAKDALEQFKQLKVDPNRTEIG